MTSASKPLHVRRLASIVCYMSLAALSAGGCTHSTGPDVTDLTPDLAAPRASARYEAVKTLGNLGPRAAVAAPSLVPMLKDPDASVRVAAAYALGKIGPTTPATVAALTAALADPDRTVRAASAYALPELGVDAVAAVSSLQRTAARDVDPEVRRQASSSLARIATLTKFRGAVEKAAKSRETSS